MTEGTLGRFADLTASTRADFEVVQRWAFLDNSFIGPMPRPVKEAGMRHLAARAADETDVFGLLATVDRVRTKFAGLIGADPSEIGFLYTTSEAENVVTRALDLQPGDNIVTGDLAYPHTLVLGRHLEQTLGIELRIARHRGGRLALEDFLPLIDGRTRLVTVPWVSNINALRHPVRGLADAAHAVGALLLVDAVQIVGTERLDVVAEGIDLLCTGCYKWLMAGFGVAPFYVRKDLQERIVPDRQGWQTALRAREADGGLRYRSTAARFEYATPAFDTFPLVEAAIDYLEAVGLDRIHAHSRRWLGTARSELESAGFTIFTPPGNVAAALSFWVGAGDKEVDAAFRAAGIRIGFASGSRISETYGANVQSCRVRISPAHYNDGGDLERFLQVAARLPRYRPED
jgi:selenocysteine lyase/cysteine desulfurase